MSKSTSFKNIIIHSVSEGKTSSEESNVNELLIQETNSFIGWECWAGIQNITIDNEGNVWRAICRQGNKLGDIYEGFEIPKETVICQKKRCNCAADLQLSKAKPEYRNLLRVGKAFEKNS